MRLEPEKWISHHGTRTAQPEHNARRAGHCAGRNVAGRIIVDWIIVDWIIGDGYSVSDSERAAKQRRRGDVAGERPGERPIGHR